VFPGLSASDASTLPLRHYITSLGYKASGWNQGYNFGPRAGVLAAAVSQIAELYERTGHKKVSLIGWSLGGVYARELAKLMPDKVRLVITLGTPFVGSPRSTNAWRVYELTRGRTVDDELQNFELEKSPPVPTTSVYSRTDGIVAWKCSIQPKQKHNANIENVEVVASHIGIGMNPTAWWVVADRLAQPVDGWKPFKRTGRIQGLLFPAQTEPKPA
jgi:thioesterase domain-containing protein